METLQVRRRGSRKRALDTRRHAGSSAGERTLEPVLCVKCPHGRTQVPGTARVETYLPGLRFIQERDELIHLCGKHVTVVSGNRAELASMSVLKSPQDRGVDWHYIAPGKPMQNGFVESFKGCRHAREIIGNWRLDYNLNRPHTSFNGLAPIRVCNAVQEGPKPEQG